MTHTVVTTNVKAFVYGGRPLAAWIQVHNNSTRAVARAALLLMPQRPRVLGFRELVGKPNPRDTSRLLE